MGILLRNEGVVGGMDSSLVAKIGNTPLNTTAQDLSGAVNELDASKIVTLTNAEYEALTPEEKNNNKYYHITDRVSSDLLDVNVMQTESTTNADYEVLLSNNASTVTETSGVKKSSGLKYNPSTGDLELTHGSSDIVLSGTDNYWYGTKTSLKDAVSTLNTSLSQIVIVRAKNLGNLTLAANGGTGYVDSDINDVDGYTPLGIIGYTGSGTTGTVLQEMFYNTNNSHAYVYLRNMTSSSVTVSNVTVRVLYMKTSMM